ncbi:MAG: magnesium transporter CorA family protein [bacterium]
MLNIFKIKDKAFYEVENKEYDQGCWFNLVTPTADELKYVSGITGVNLDFLKAALDDEELSRMELEEDALLLITNVPIMGDKHFFDTLPLGIILTPKHFITVSLKENQVLSSFISFGKGFEEGKNTRFLLEILFRSSKLYLKYLRYINRRTDELENDVKKTMKNQALYQLLDLEKSLVYFTTALKDNGIVLEKLLRLRKNNNYKHLLEMNEDDEDLLEDVIIENKQALEMVEMHSNILSGMMDAFASIISNNLNIVMKFLTTMTIVLTTPTMVASFFGMNVHVPWGQAKHGFWYVIVISAILTSITVFTIFRKEKIR